MHIPDKYRERYDALAKGHPWMREMRDEQAPEGDAVAILRRYATFWSVSHETHTQCDSNWEATTMRALADMVERDYVSRQDFAAQHRTLCAVREQRDDMKSELDRYEHDCILLFTERDELKAMNEKLQVALDAVEGCDERCKKLEAERDYWRWQIRKCLDATRCGDDAKESLMAYPLPTGRVQPYLMVVDKIDSERDFMADIERLERERDGWRDEVGDLWTALCRLESRLDAIDEGIRERGVGGD